MLICQLPNLRYLNAHINDERREQIDRDIDHLTGNHSLRYLVLHIENLKWDRLKLILSLMFNLNRVELNGTVDFDLNNLFNLAQQNILFRFNLRYHSIF